MMTQVRQNRYTLCLYLFSLKLVKNIIVIYLGLKKTAVRLPAYIASTEITTSQLIAKRTLPDPVIFTILWPVGNNRHGFAPCVF